MMPQSSVDKISAVVVPDFVQDCRDVLPASSNLTKCTPFPFGLSVNACEENSQTPEYMQKLIYVSERVARDRSPGRHSMNGTGVRAGWYLIARPGRFNVHVSYVNQKHYGLPWENGLAVDLEVDGQNTNITFQYEQNKDPILDTNDQDWVFRGYLTKSAPSDRSQNVKRDTFHPFAFESLSNAREKTKVGHSDVGTIKLNVYAGVIRAFEEKSRTERFKYSRNKVSAKAVAREGTTMRVSKKQSAVSLKVHYSDYYVSNARILRDAEVRIYVREPSWLHSRRLIHENEVPITYSAYRELLQAAQLPFTVCNTIHDFINVDEEEPGRKKRRVRDFINLDADPNQQCEIIDLT